MNRRTILAVDTLSDQLADRFIVRIVRAPFQVNGAQKAQVLPLAPEQLPPLGTAAAVHARGIMVRDALRTHSGVSTILDRLGEIPDDEVSPLFMMLGPSDAELINWEMLCDGNEAFLALDPRWPIARIIEPVNAQSRAPAELASPIRMMAVISALGIADQRKEWELVRDAAESARDAGLQVRLKLLVGDAGLRADIEQAIAGGLADTEVGHVDDTAARVTQAIRGWAPNILHFFCHGIADAGGQRLELATAGDHLQYAANNPDVTHGSVAIPTQDLRTLGASLSNPWLLVLNCCASGQAASGLQSMANQVVAGGFPAVVAMLEPVDAADAYEFTRAFYPEAFAALKAASDELVHEPRTSVEWTPAMYYARRAISQLNGRDAKASPEWSLPVLYVRGTEPQVFERARGLSDAQASDYRTRAETAARWLQTAGQHLSEAERIEALQKALAMVPESFWPAPDGSFPGAR